jgi:uncharacterized protein with von Willebrand factor type A (vWA) domain
VSKGVVLHALGASAPLPQAAELFVGFGRLLRLYGYPVASDQVMAFMEGVTLLGPRSIEDIREAALATLAPSPDRRDEFEALFRSHFFDDFVAPVEGDNEEETRVKDDGGQRKDQTRTLRLEEGGALSSSAEHLTIRTFDTDGEDGELLRFRRALASCLPVRRTFRTVRTPSRGSVDLRRSLWAIVRADGDVPRLPLRRRQSVVRKVLLLIDVSGSMKLHTKDYLKAAHAVAQATNRAEIFTFGTRLTRITPSLRIRDRDHALASAANRVDDWDGGTRIGTTLLAFLSVPRFAAFARGAAIVILSDALERGDHTEMETAMHRLGKRSFRLSLCTPLAGDPRFRPETAALRAILPVLDDLVDGSSIAGLTNFILSLGRPIPRAEAIWRRP